MKKLNWVSAVFSSWLLQKVSPRTGLISEIQALELPISSCGHVVSTQRYQVLPCTSSPLISNPKTCWKKLPPGSWNLNSFDLLLLCGCALRTLNTNSQSFQQPMLTSPPLPPSPAPPATQLLYLSICSPSHLVSYPSLCSNTLKPCRVARFVRVEEEGWKNFISTISSGNWKQPHKSTNHRSLHSPNPSVSECQLWWSPCMTPL